MNPALEVIEGKVDSRLLETLESKASAVIDVIAIHDIAIVLISSLLLISQQLRNPPQHLVSSGWDDLPIVDQVPVSGVIRLSGI